jgi:hypothetical protein
MFIDDNDSIILFPGSLDRTIDHTGWMVALIAEAWEKVSRNVWIFSLFDNLYP